MHVPQAMYEELASTVDDLCVLWDMCLLRWNKRAITVDIQESLAQTLNATHCYSVCPLVFPIRGFDLPQSAI